MQSLTLHTVGKEHTTEARCVSWFVLFLFLVTYDGLTFFLHADVLPDNFSIRLFVETGGVITYTLFGYLVKLVVTVGGILFIAGRLRPVDVGLKREGIPGAIVILLSVWLVVQAIQLGLGRLAGTPGVEMMWLETPTGVLVGRGLQEFIGTAFVEEVVYRGFLLQQLFLKTEHLLPGREPWRMVFALWASQWYFGLNHIPAGLGQGMTYEQLTVFVVHTVLMGVFFAAIYLRTGNLWLSMGVHALVNNPLTIFRSPVDASLIVLVLAVVLLLAWPFLHVCMPSVFTLAEGVRGAAKKVPARTIPKTHSVPVGSKDRLYEKQPSQIYSEE